MSDGLGFQLSLPGPLSLEGMRTRPVDQGTSEAAVVASEFEAAFLAQSVDEMLKTSDVGAFGGGHAEEMWRSFLAKAVADKIATTSSTDVASQIEAAIAAYEKWGGR
ncbi:Rod binding protein [Roseivivax sp. THAF40]|uniref:rod-binding protein n=1 Tax=Roseivivax sp. THAF40 TaxID=2587858 RepID=UPI001267EDEA|nr:rod-binding protein [Roseivivax sp. THAF40]QFT47388.1 Rod binding protein [Roseivivax sp. THAF40]